jgi:adenylate cyclase
MPKEIERKYLVDHSKWKELNKTPAELYRQGYLLTDPQKTIRVRLTSSNAYLTVKSISTGASRDEYEYEIPVKDAGELLDNLCSSELSKKRYKIVHKENVWEVDEFLGANAGLIVAEIELTDEDQTFETPEWIDKEVTGEEKYYNSNLTLNPYTKW